MSSIMVVWTGRRAPEAVEALAADYRERVARFVPCDEIRLRPAPGRDGDPQRALALEAEALRRHLRPGDQLVVLDERGRERATRELATWLQQRLRRGRLVLVVGSDLGLDATFAARADEAISLSKMTLPHHIARVILFEQLFRCLDLLAGGPYHRD